MVELTPAYAGLKEFAAGAEATTVRIAATSSTGLAPASDISLLIEETNEIASPVPGLIVIGKSPESATLRAEVYPGIRSSYPPSSSVCLRNTVNNATSSRIYNIAIAVDVRAYRVVGVERPSDPKLRY
mgnify:CR=1 FL=1